MIDVFLLLSTKQIINKNRRTQQVKILIEQQTHFVLHRKQLITGWKAAELATDKSVQYQYHTRQ